MKISRIEDTPIMPNPYDLDVRQLYDTEHGEALHLTLSPRQSLERHAMPTDVFFYVLEGTGEIEIDGQRQTVGSDTAITCPANAARLWQNTGETPLQLLVVKLPRPTSPPVMVDSK